MILLVSLVLFSQERIDLPVTTPLEKNHFALSSKGDLFVLDPNRVEIYRFDIRGHLVAQLTESEGQLANLDKPVAVDVSENRLYVVDHGREAINIYDYSGALLDSVEIVHRNILPIRVKNGWVYSHDSPDDNAASCLYLSDSHEEPPRSLATFSPRTEPIRATKVKGVPPTRNLPGSDRSLIAVSPDGTTVWFYAPEQSFLFLIDIESSKVSRKIKIPHKPTPLKQVWGKERSRRLGGVSTAGIGRAPEIKPFTSKQFATITDLVVDHEQKLWLVGCSDHVPSIGAIILGPNGDRSHSEYTWESIQRLIGVHNQRAFVLAYDTQEDVPFIVVCHLSQMDEITRLFPGNSNGLVTDG